MATLSSQANSGTTRRSVRTREALGKQIYATKPNNSNVFAGMIIAALMILGGPALTVFMIRVMTGNNGAPPDSIGDWAGVVAMAVLGIGIAVGGVFLFLGMKSLFGLRLFIHHDGFCVTRNSSETIFAWDEIVRVKETVLHEKLPLVKGAAKRLMPTKTSRQYEVVRCDGETFFFDVNVLPRTSLLAGPLASAAKRFDIAWESSEEHT